MHAPPAIEAHGLHKTFYLGLLAPLPGLRRLPLGPLHRVVEAVRGVDLHVAPGEVFGLLGGNGAGKSTTMKMLMGLIHPSGGRAALFGRPARDAEARRGVGFLPENPVFYDELTPLEVLELLCALHAVPAQRRRRHAAELLARVGLTHAADRPLRRLSKGMHQRVGVAQALIGAPRLIVLDEPLSGLDPQGRREVRDALLEERARGAAIMLSSHILPDVEALCDRFAVLRAGRVTHTAPMRDLAAQVTHMDLTLRGASEALREALGALGAPPPAQHLRAHRGEWALRLPAAALPEALTRALSGGAEVVAVSPVRLTLEDLFAPPAPGGAPGVPAPGVPAPGVPAP
ncbi:MAG: ABC transporter ATP-binding protein [Deltaproteobacteria bacterium]|nr:ABC transporter ATP-binding protein [Deltaproteobacteria bacterium]